MSASSTKYPVNISSRNYSTVIGLSFPIIVIMVFMGRAKVLRVGHPPNQYQLIVHSPKRDTVATLHNVDKSHRAFIGLSL